MHASVDWLKVMLVYHRRKTTWIVTHAALSDGTQAANTAKLKLKTKQSRSTLVGLETLGCGILFT